MKKIVEFHVGRGGHFHNPGYLTFRGVGTQAKSFVEEKNFLQFENEHQIIGSLPEDQQDEVRDKIAEIDNRVGSDLYEEFCKQYGDLGGLLLVGGSGEYIGEYKEDGQPYCYEEDGYYDTTYGIEVETWDDLSDEEKEAVKRSQNRYEFEMEFGDIPNEEDEDED